jgi:hypothetical protein
MGVYSHKERSTRDGYNAFPRDMLRQCFFYGIFLHKFDRKNMILANTNDFSCEKWCKFDKCQKENNSNCQISTLSSNR